jgi:hypothetical protein
VFDRARQIFLGGFPRDAELIADLLDGIACDSV